MATPARTVMDDIPCTVCRQSLHGLSAGDPCPGCGTTVEWSVDGGSTPKPPEPAPEASAPGPAPSPRPRQKTRRATDATTSDRARRSPRAMPEVDPDVATGLISMMTDQMASAQVPDDATARWEQIADRADRLLDRIERLVELHEDSNDRRLRSPRRAG